MPRPRIKALRRDDLLVEPGGAWPWDAWTVFYIDWPSISLERPYESIIYWDMAGGKKRTTFKEIEFWDRVWPIDLEKPMQGFGLFVEVKHVKGQGAAVLSWPFGSHDIGTLAHASTDPARAIAVASAIVRGRLPRLEDWVSHPTRGYETDTAVGSMRIAPYDDEWRVITDMEEIVVSSPEEGWEEARKALKSRAR